MCNNYIPKCHLASSCVDYICIQNTPCTLMYLLVKSPVRDAHMRKWYSVRVLPAGNTYLNMRMVFTPCRQHLKPYKYMYEDVVFCLGFPYRQNLDINKGFNPTKIARFPWKPLFYTRSPQQPL